ncbi:MAG TPA: hypothetical protein VHR45_17130 [Thermoanaerobaculia bacterium]|nr:hypothetical protein [Thermoanaerobaculia bacterium]
MPTGSVSNALYSEVKSLARQSAVILAAQQVHAGAQAADPG